MPKTCNVRGFDCLCALNCYQMNNHEVPDLKTGRTMALVDLPKWHASSKSCICLWLAKEWNGLVIIRKSKHWELKGFSKKYVVFIFGYCYSFRSSRNRTSTIHSNNVYINWKTPIYALMQSMAVSAPILTEQSLNTRLLYSHTLLNTGFRYSVPIFNQTGQEIRKRQVEQYLRP